jgi:hypothetical protein
MELGGRPLQQKKLSFRPSRRLVVVLKVENPKDYVWETKAKDNQWPRDRSLLARANGPAGSHSDHK